MRNAKSWQQDALDATTVILQIHVKLSVHVCHTQCSGYCCILYCVLAASKSSAYSVFLLSLRRTVPEKYRLILIDKDESISLCYQRIARVGTPAFNYTYIVSPGHAANFAIFTS